MGEGSRVMGKWYTIEHICNYLFGRVLMSVVLDFENAWEKEYYFSEGELDRTKEEFEKALKKNPKNMTINSRNMGDLLLKKRYKGEDRKKQPTSIKFIMDEI